jgi:hypothetical protein
MIAFASLRRRVTILVVAVTLSLGFSVSSVHADGKDHVLLTQQDVVQAFDLMTGLGYQVGTVTGDIVGTTLVEFQFTATGAPVGDVLPIAFQNKVTITDIDGDQIFFDNNGTGKFHVGAPGAPFQGSGGPLVGTYVVSGGTGKFKSVKIGSTFAYRAIATNPPAPPDRLGTVFVEVSELHDRR